MTTLADCINRWPHVTTLIQVVGALYCWGAGDLRDVRNIVPSVPSTFPKGSKGGQGLDCSGLAQWALWVLGIVKPDAWVDLSAHDLANACDAVEPDEAKPGDLYFYKNKGNSRIHHVTVALGNGLCLHASGNSRTTGNKPAKSVQIVHYTRAGNYLVAGTLKQQFRP